MAKVAADTKIYVCGHCRTNNHHRCPRLITAGKNVQNGPTPCQCRHPEHDDTRRLW